MNILNTQLKQLVVLLKELPKSNYLTPQKLRKLIRYSWMSPIKISVNLNNSMKSKKLFRPQVSELANRLTKENEVLFLLAKLKAELKTGL